MTIEFKVVQNRTEHIPPSDEEIKQYNQMVKWHEPGGNHIMFPKPTVTVITVAKQMSELSKDGWQVHTFSVDPNGNHFALMEREVPDEST